MFFLVIYKVFSRLQPGIAFNLTYKDQIGY